MTDHPITPPTELVRQWTTSFDCPEAWGPKDQWIASKAAQWGADQELEACCEYVYERLKMTTIAHIAQDLRAARRPKPPNLKEQALEQLDGIAAVFRMTHGGNLVCDTIRRALEQLND